MNSRYGRYFDFIKEAAAEKERIQKSIKMLRGVLGYKKQLDKGVDLEKIIAKAESMAVSGDEGAKRFLVRAKNAKNSDELKAALESDALSFEAVSKGNKVKRQYRNADGTTEQMIPRVSNEKITTVSSEQNQAKKLKIQEAQQNATKNIKDQKQQILDEVSKEYGDIPSWQFWKKKKILREAAPRLEAVKATNQDEFRNVNFNTKEEAVAYLNKKKQDAKISNYTTINKPAPKNNAEDVADAGEELVNDKPFKEQAKDAWKNYKKRFKEKPLQTGAYTAAGVGTAGGLGYMMFGGNGEPIEKAASLRQKAFEKLASVNPIILANKLKQFESLSHMRELASKGKNISKVTDQLNKIAPEINEAIRRLIMRGERKGFTPQQVIEGLQKDTGKTLNRMGVFDTNKALVVRSTPQNSVAARSTPQTSAIVKSTPQNGAVVRSTSEPEVIITKNPNKKNMNTGKPDNIEDAKWTEVETPKTTARTAGTAKPSTESVPKGEQTAKAKSKGYWARYKKSFNKSPYLTLGATAGGVSAAGGLGYMMYDRKENS